MKSDFKFPQILLTVFLFKSERVTGTCRYAGRFLQESSNEPGIFSPLALLCHIVCRMNVVELVWLPNELKDRWDGRVEGESADLGDRFPAGRSWLERGG